MTHPRRNTSQTTVAAGRYGAALSFDRARTAAEVQADMNAPVVQ
jgi:hypothetical protein